MSVEENKALVRRLLERVRDGWSPAVIEEFFAPVTEDISIPQRHRLLPWVNKRERTDFAAFPDATATLEDIVAEGDRVAYRLTIRGTHQGAFQDIAPTGKHVTVSFTAIVRIEGGRLVEEWGGLDLFDLRQQLEALAPARADNKHG